LRRRVTSCFRWLRIRLPQPWSLRLARLAYLPRLLARHEPTRRTFVEEQEIERLRAGGGRLDGVGDGLSERVVEVPWALRLLDAQPAGTVLDVGTAFAPVVYKRWLVRLAHRVETLDLAPTTMPGATSHRGDVRRTSLASDSFDYAVCISTLEHVGLDNSQYGLGGSHDQPDDEQDGLYGGPDRAGHAPEELDAGDVLALRELGRVARRVLVTVPAGRDADMGWQRQYSPRRFRRVVEQAGLSFERLELFVHDPAGGWRAATEEEVLTRTYGDGAIAAAAIICAELRRR
jgi:hypothetical protein